MHGRNSGSLQGATCFYSLDVVASGSMRRWQLDFVSDIDINKCVFAVRKHTAVNQAVVTRSHSAGASEDMSEKGQSAKKKSKIFACCQISVKLQGD